MTRNSKIVLSVTAAITLVVAWVFLPVGVWVEGLGAWISGLGALGAVAFVIIYVIATCVLAPASALTLLAGLAYGVWGFPLVVVSATLGAGAAFLIGRYAARERVQERIEDFRRFKAVNAAVGQEGWKIVFLMRLSPVFPFGLQNYFFSVSTVGFGPYLLATFVGIMPGTALYVYLGSIGQAAGGGGGVAQWMLLGAGLIATGAVVWLVTKRSRRALEAMDLEPGSAETPHAGPNDS